MVRNRRMFPPLTFSIRDWNCLGRFSVGSLVWVLLCLAFLHLFCRRPYKKDAGSALGVVLTYSLAFVFLGALLIKVNAQPSGGLERSIFEIVLIFLLLMGPGLIIVNITWSYLKKIFDRCNKRTSTPKQVTERSKKVQVRRSRIRQVSLVRSSNSRANSRRPGICVNSNTKTAHDNIRVTDSEGTHTWATSPMAISENGHELNEARKERATIIIVGDGIELQEIKKDLLEVTRVEDGFKSKGIKEELSAF